METTPAMEMALMMELPAKELTPSMMLTPAMELPEKESRIPHL